MVSFSLTKAAFLASWFAVTARAAAAGFPPPPTPRGLSGCGKTCVVYPSGGDDTPAILRAFEECNNGGTVVFPEGMKYNIDTKLNPVIYDVTIDWKGEWVVSPQRPARWADELHDGLGPWAGQG